MLIDLQGPKGSSHVNSRDEISLMVKTPILHVGNSSSILLSCIHFSIFILLVLFVLKYKVVILIFELYVSNYYTAR